MPECLQFKPIGFFKTRKKVKTYDLPRQPLVMGAPSLSELDYKKCDYIELEKDYLFEQALEKLDGFSRIWVIFLFHENNHWNPKIRPPRGEKNKIGVFASRSPYRPNPIGMSCVELIKIKGLRLYLADSDILNNTPILDIKPYIPFCDSFTDSKIGWLENIETTKYNISFSQESLDQISFLKNTFQLELEFFITSQLSYEPLNKDKKRLWIHEEHAFLGYKTWLVKFRVNETSKEIFILKINSGYSSKDLAPGTIDKYQDKISHRIFIEKFGHDNLK